MRLRSAQIPDPSERIFSGRNLPKRSASVFKYLASKHPFTLTQCLLRLSHVAPVNKRFYTFLDDDYKPSRHY
ncbi:unnamed protein product, partial [Nesidiocoris tenuis]